jgi:Fic family protein
MKSFENGFIEKQIITQNLLQSIRAIGEYKGKQELFTEQSPQVLETLRTVAVIQSVESSNRIEGITASPDRIKELVADKTTPANRSEQEIAGYRDVLTTIHVNFDTIAFTPGVVFQFHRALYQFVPGQGGRWKTSDNEISEILPDGTKRLRFKPVPAYLTAEAVEHLHSHFNSAWSRKHIEPLLLVSSYVLDFLCIHPFLDGNGRMARLITLLLLYKAGYFVGRYISFEMIVERTRESYYDALYRSSRGWHEGTHNLVPWWEYFIGVVILSAYKEFENRVGLIIDTHGAKSEMVMTAVKKLPQQFSHSDVARACPHVSRPTIKRVLGILRQEGKIVCVKSGRDALWQKTGS